MSDLDKAAERFKRAQADLLGARAAVDVAQGVLRTAEEEARQAARRLQEWEFVLKQVAAGSSFDDADRAWVQSGARYGKEL